MDIVLAMDIDSPCHILCFATQPRWNCNHMEEMIPWILGCVHFVKALSHVWWLPLEPIALAFGQSPSHWEFLSVSWLIGFRWVMIIMIPTEGCMGVPRISPINRDHQGILFTDNQGIWFILVPAASCGILQHPAAKELQLYQRSAIGQSASDLVRTHGLTSEASA